jgi:hypothetical protein
MQFAVGEDGTSSRATSTAFKIVEEATPLVEGVCLGCSTTTCADGTNKQSPNLETALIYMGHVMLNAISIWRILQRFSRTVSIFRLKLKLIKMFISY